MSNGEEVLEGFVVDVACIRKYPQGELLDRARVHTRDCALMGHCVESGYGLVDDDGRVALLDTAATPLVVGAVQGSPHDRGITLRATRERRGEEMHTTRVDAA